MVHDKLATISGARAAGEWLQRPGSAEHVAELASAAALGALTVLDDHDVQDLVEALVRRHVVNPEWGPLLGRAIESFVAGEHQEPLIDLAAERLEEWLIHHPDAFDRAVSARLPAWLPSIAQRFVDGRLHAEAVRFARAVTRKE